MAMMQHVLAVSVMLLAVQTVAIDQVCADQATCESSLANEAMQASALLQTHALTGTATSAQAWVAEHKFKQELSPSSDETLEDLQAKKKAAIDAEDFDTAKKIKEQIKERIEQIKADLEQQKKDAILAEDFDTAKKIKEQLDAMEGMTSAEKTEVEATAEKKEVEAIAENMEVEATAEKKEVEAAAEMTEVEATAEKTEVEATAGKTEAEATVDMTEVKATAERRAAMEPGCYVLLPNGCRGVSSAGDTQWKRDEWGETNMAAAENQTACLQVCRDFYDEYCGVNDTQMMYVSPVDSAGEQTAVKSMRSLLRESFSQEEAKEFAENLEKPEIEDGDENDSSSWW